ncbi:TonB-dependent receptor plug domain-containing protein [Novosphingobium album (ex Hu et al. 2023)]|uniref:TonB-dependent receptor plug domain-containing protein n=1 Tax=Novosphingobium album (ex Hu et al. 2023) TaxID=2930093 RepID=A0ABT0B772_9SPHN|nr:TonB-dependent receptor [Novosphingobium album (ex Hu et al. 2023)]MCJ2180708.1 TonB-dependent receptor plug domain-containing protein [Novosphingobium album (ex Hu et al. 2023)]
MNTRFKHQLTYILASAATGALLCAAPARAADAASDADSAADPSTIVVTGQAVEATQVAEEAVEFGNYVQIVDAKQIEASGASNFAELAQFLIKGANVGYSPDEGEYTIRLDGGGDRDTLVVLDGVPLYDRGPALEEIWGTTTIDPHMIERVEVFRGGNSLFFGSNGGIGVVSIVTKRPDGTNKVELGASYGSFNSRELWGNARAALDSEGRISAMVYGSMQDTDGPRLFNPDDFVDNVAAAGAIHTYPLNRTNVGMKFLFKPSDATEIRLNGQYTQIEFDDAFPDNEVISPNRVRYPIIDGSITHRWSDKLLTEFSAYWSNPKLNNTETYAEVCRQAEGCIDPATGAAIAFGDATGRSIPYPNKGFGKDSKVSAFMEYGMNLRNTLMLPNVGEAVFGVQRTSYRNDSDPVFPISHEWNTTTGVYLDVRPTLPFSPNTKVSLAGRVDFSKAFDSKFIWKFGLRQPIGAFYVRANGGTSYSLPKTNELFMDTVDRIGNPDLKPESTETYNGAIGFAKTFGDVSISGEAGIFHTDITNRIQSTSGLTPNTYYNNTAVTQIRGLTADLNLAIGKQWTFNLGYTRQKAHLKGSDLQINETPEYMIQGTAAWSSPDDRFHVNLFPRYQGPEYATGGIGGSLRHNFGNYLVVNGSIAFWAGEEKQHRFQLRFVNIFDEKYAERYGYGNMRFSSAFIRGEMTTSDPDYYFGYPFEGKPRSVFFSYTTSF